MQSLKSIISFLGIISIIKTGATVRRNTWKKFTFSILVFIGNKFIGLTFSKLKEKFIIRKIKYTINIIFAAIVIDFIPFIASNVLNIKNVPKLSIVCLGQR